MEMRSRSEVRRPNAASASQDTTLIAQDILPPSNSHSSGNSTIPPTANSQFHSQQVMSPVNEKFSAFRGIKLNERNFESWRIEMMLHFKLCGLWTYLAEADSVDSAKSIASQVPVSVNEKLYGIILTSIESIQVYKFIHISDAAAVCHDSTDAVNILMRPSRAAS
jgi:hypothetical protein